MTEHRELEAEDAVSVSSSRWQRSRGGVHPGEHPQKPRSTAQGPQSRSSAGGFGPGQTTIAGNDGNPVGGPRTTGLIDHLGTLDMSCMVCGEQFSGEGWQHRLAGHMGQHFLSISNEKKIDDEQTASGPYSMHKSFSEVREAVEVRAKVRAEEEQERRVNEKIGRLILSDSKRRFLQKHDLQPNEVYADGEGRRKRAPDPAEDLRFDKPPALRKALMEAEERWRTSRPPPEIIPEGQADWLRQMGERWRKARGWSL